MVAVGSTAIEPLAAVDVNVPGVMAMLAAPLVTHASVLLEPNSMLDGVAVNDVIFGLSIVTVLVDVTEPAVLVAVSV